VFHPCSTVAIRHVFGIAYQAKDLSTWSLKIRVFLIPTHALTDKESEYVCDEIGELIAHGVSRLDAQGRLARRMSQGLAKQSEVV
jgi:hypothetical protein